MVAIATIPVCTEYLKKIRALTPIQTIKGTSQLSIYDNEHLRLVLQI